MNESYNTQEDLTLRDVLLGIGDYSRELWLRKWWVVLLAALFAILFALNSSRQPLNYRGVLTFMVNEDEGGGLGGVAAILGQLGVGSANAGEFNMAKIVEISKSRMITQAILLDSATIDNKSNLLAHHLISTYGLRDTWRENEKEKWSEVRFVGTEEEEFSVTQRKVLQSLIKMITGSSNTQGLVSISTDINTNILKLKAATLDEQLTQLLLDKVYDKLASFYIDKVTKNSQVTITNLTVQKDSIQQELKRAEYALANQIDRNLGIYERKSEVVTGQLRRQVQILNVMYGEVIRNLAAATFALQNTTPIFSVIDRPFLPLSRDKPEIVKSAIIGGVTGAFFAAVILIIFTFLRRTIA